MCYPRKSQLVPITAICAFLLALLALVCHAKAAGRFSSTEIKWNSAEQGKFVTALCQDHHGNLWVGTEDHGVWEYHAQSHHWQQFTVSSTGGTPSKFGPVLTAGTPNEHALGDNHIYAIACDRLGRIWVGHANHGVSVYNGKSWRNYDVIDGPLGARVFAIATCPVDGDVWIATDDGLTRYSLSHHSWSYCTKGVNGRGLPSNQIQAIAFARDGTIYAATQCHGLAICHPTKNYSTHQLVYRQWRTVKSRFIDQPPLTPMGRGLPSNLLNDVMVGRHGTIWVATDEGLAWSRNRGLSWRFIRGRDWKVKDRRLYRPPSHQEIDGIIDRYHRDSHLLLSGSHLLLSGDYVTCLGEDSRGYIWLGHWLKGVEVFDPKPGKHHYHYRSNRKPKHPRKTSTTTKKAVASNHLGPRDDVSCVLILPGQRPIVGFYGGGVVQMPQRFREKTRRRRYSYTHQHHTPNAANDAYPPLPPAAKPPSSSYLKRLIRQVKGFRRLVWAAYMGDDWTTQGDWFGRYGRQSGWLLAAGGAFNHDFNGNQYWEVQGFDGPHHRHPDCMRHWILSLKTDNEETLYDPDVGHRRQASWDDHGEIYPMTHQGPGLWIKISVPRGIDRLSLYFFNKDVYRGRNRLRDYRIDIKQFTPRIAEALRERPLASARVHNFRESVYKRFLIHGPGEYWIHLSRNYSYNTIISGVMLDRLVGKPMFNHFPQANTAGIGYHPPKVGSIIKVANKRQHAPHWALPIQLWQAVGNAWHQRGTAAVAESARVLAYRAALADHAPKKWLTYARWKLPLWAPGGRKAFDASVKRFWKALVKKYPKTFGHGDM